LKLRPRLALTLLGAALPLLLGLAWLQGELLRRAEEEAVRGFVLARLDERGRERCEADPARFADPPRHHVGEGRHFHGPPRLFAYDERFQAANPAAPPLPADIQRALKAGGDAASSAQADGLLVAVRTPWGEGNCAVLATLRQRRPGVLPGLASGGLVACGGLAVAVLLAAGPVVRRIRALTRDVQRSAAGHYVEPVPITGSDEVAELARAFNEAAREVRSRLDSLNERDRTLRAFLANTTHDLMLPLTVLQGHLSRLQQQAREGRSDPALLAAATEECAYLGSLLHNLGAVAKLEAGEPRPEPGSFDLGAVVERAVERHRPLAAPRGIELGHAVPEPPLFVRGDVTLVEQAVSNLVHNAVRHNRDGGHVGVVLDELDGGRFRLQVSDDGPGVPADQLARLGERRFRTDEARQRHPEGLGLGLSIASEVASRHGFELRFSAGESGGLSVELIGPVVPA
jgi:signal transduction histidine kinase